MNDRPRLPLTALRVFEAAARHESFLQAAEELAITPGAVSRQIKALETELAVRLFDRFNRAVRLTDAGQRLAVGIGRGLRQMQAAVEEARGARAGPLVVTAMHSFAARWLVPRLHHFSARYPDVQVMVAASDAAVDLAHDNYDLAIRFSRGGFPGLSATKLVSLFMFPVCSPRFLEEHPLRSPHDLAQAPLFSDVYLAVGEPTWGDWLTLAGAPEVDWQTRGLQFSNVYLAIEALRSGTLVKPFDIELQSPFSQWIVTLPEKADRPDVRRFRNWLLAQAEADGLRRFE
jgi:LysR family glycine cleavage system transcriptional activator